MLSSAPLPPWRARAAAAPGRTTERPHPTDSTGRRTDPDESDPTSPLNATQPRRTTREREPEPADAPTADVPPLDPIATVATRHDRCVRRVARAGRRMRAGEEAGAGEGRGAAAPELRAPVGHR